MYSRTQNSSPLWACLGSKWGWKEGWPRRAGAEYKVFLWCISSWVITKVICWTQTSAGTKRQTMFFWTFMLEGSWELQHLISWWMRFSWKGLMMLFKSQLCFSLASVGISCWLPVWPGMKLSRSACMWSGPGDTDPWLVVPGVAAGSHVAVLELLHSSGRSLDDVQIVPHLSPSPWWDLSRRQLVWGSPGRWWKHLSCWLRAWVGPHQDRQAGWLVLQWHGWDSGGDVVLACPAARFRQGIGFPGERAGLGCAESLPYPWKA